MTHPALDLPAFALPADAHPVMHDGLACWRRAAPAPDSLPGRQHIDPLRMPRLLPHVWLIDIHPPGHGMDIPRFRFRLVGSHVDLGFGGPRTGCWLDEIEPDFNTNAGMHESFVACADAAMPSHRRGGPRFRFNADAASLERMMLPLAADGRRVDMLLGFTVFFDSRGELLRPLVS